MKHISALRKWNTRNISDKRSSQSGVTPRFWLLLLLFLLISAATPTKIVMFDDGDYVLSKSIPTGDTLLVVSDTINKKPVAKLLVYQTFTEFSVATLCEGEIDLADLSKYHILLVKSR